MTDNPLVSIIVITYNSSKYVLETLESAKSQTYRNIELILSDDCSTDNTVEIVEGWIKENTGFFKRCTISKSIINTGIPANCNRGIKLAKGEWIKLIAGDDSLYPYIIEEYINFINKNQEVYFVHSDVDRYISSFNEESRMKPAGTRNFRINRDGITAKEQFQILLRINRVLAPTVMVNRRKMVDLGLFDETLFWWEDKPMWLKVTYSGIKLNYLDIPGVKYRIHNKSVTQKSQNAIFPKFLVEVNREKLKKHHFKDMPFAERLTRTILAKQVVIIDKLKVPNFFLFRWIIKGISYPLTWYEKKINNKYL